MKRKNSSNNEFLSAAKKTSSPKIYSLILHLVNEGRKDLADDVMKIDCLLEYASGYIKDHDYEEAEDMMKKAEDRMSNLEKEDIDTEYLRYLSEGIKKKIK